MSCSPIVVVLNNIKNFKEDLVNIGEKIKIKITNWDCSLMFQETSGLYLSCTKDYVGVTVNLLTEEGSVKTVCLVCGDIAEITLFKD